MHGIGVFGWHNDSFQSSAVTEHNNRGGHSHWQNRQESLQIIDTCYRATAESNEYILDPQSARLGWPILFKQENLDTRFLFQPELAAQFRSNGNLTDVQPEITPDHSPMFEQLRKNCFGSVHGHSETNPLCGLDYGGVNPNNATSRIHEWPPGVTRVQSGIGLNDVVDQVTGDTPKGVPQCRDNPSSNSRFKPKRASDRHSELTDLEFGRITERRE